MTNQQFNEFATLIDEHIKEKTGGRMKYALVAVHGGFPDFRYLASSQNNQEEVMNLFLSAAATIQLSLDVKKAEQERTAEQQKAAKKEAPIQ